MDTNAELVIQIVLDNLPTPEAKVISRIACCSKDLHRMAQDYLASINIKNLKLGGSGRKLLQTHTRTKSLCVHCNRKLTNLFNPLSQLNPSCEDCTKSRHIFTTEAQRRYRLTPTELAKFDCIITYHKTYHTELRQYPLHLIKAYSYLKHKGLPPPYVHHKDSQTRKRRQEQMESMLTKHIPVEHHQSLHDWIVVKSFIKSGDKGVREMQRILSAYKPLKEAVAALESATHPIDILQYLVVYSENPEASLNMIRDRISDEQARDQRREDLKTALATHGLQLRSDSAVCEQYIQNGAGNLETTVRLMRQMDYFHKHTNYPRIYSQLLQDAYDTATQEIHDEHGWIENHYYFEELLEERIDRHALSREAKEIVLETLVDVPDYLILLV